MSRVIGCLLTVFVIAASATADLAPLSEADLQAKASHVVSGRAQRVYRTVERVNTDHGPYDHTYYVVEFDIDSVDKGDELSGKGLLYVRLKTIAWKGSGFAPPGHNGNSNVPAKGDVVTVYLRQQNDGGYDVIMPNGCKSVSNRVNN